MKIYESIKRDHDIQKRAKDIYSDSEAASLAKGYEDTMQKYRKDWPESIPG